MPGARCRGPSDFTERQVGLAAPSPPAGGPAAAAGGSDGAAVEPLEPGDAGGGDAHAAAGTQARAERGDKPGNRSVVLPPSPAAGLTAETSTRLDLEELGLSGAVITVEVVRNFAGSKFPIAASVGDQQAVWCCYRSIVRV